MNLPKRNLLRGAASSAGLAVAAAAGLIRPSQVLAASPWAWPIFGEPTPTITSPTKAAPVKAASAKVETELQKALKAMQTAQPQDSDGIRIKAPAIAEDGASVFIEITSSLPAVDVLAVFVEQNPQQLVQAFLLAPETLAELQTRIKVAKSSRIWVVARSAGQFYKAITHVKVTIGGCGMGVN